MQIVNVVLPTLSRYFAAPLSSVQWTAIAYLLAVAMVIPASGWIGDLIGLRRTFIFALALFTLASAGCGVVHSLVELIAARAIQGAGGGMLIPAGTAMLYRTYPPEQRARVTRNIILPILIGPGAAPVLGGVLTEWISWRWVFLLNVPVGVVLLVFSWRFLPRFASGSRSRLDILGVALSGVGLTALLYAVSEGSTLGWSSARIVGCGLVGTLFLGAFTRRSLHDRDPLLRVFLLSDRLFRATNIVFALSAGPFIGSLYLTPIFLQSVMHQSPITSGTTTFVEALGVGIGSQSFARLYPLLGPRSLAAIGSAGLVIYLSMFLLVEPGTSLWIVRAAMLFGGLCNSGPLLATQASMFTTISDVDIGHAVAIYNSQRQATIALSVAILTTIAVGTASVRVAAFHSAYFAAALVAAVGTVAALALIHTSDARATMCLPASCYDDARRPPLR